MSKPVPLCTHVKASGLTCGSPAVKGTALCYHHSAIKTALGKWSSANKGTCPSIPFVFPEDRTGLQINYFLLLQAFTEQRIDLRTFNSMQRLVRAMDKNLGQKPLCEDAEVPADTEIPSEIAIPTEAEGSDSDSAVVLNERAAQVDEPFASKEPTICGRSEGVNTVPQHSPRHVVLATSASSPISAVDTAKYAQVNTVSTQSYRAPSSREKARPELANRKFTPEEIEVRLAALKPQYFGPDRALAANSHGFDIELRLIAPSQISIGELWKRKV